VPVDFIEYSAWIAHPHVHGSRALLSLAPRDASVAAVTEAGNRHLHHQPSAYRLKGQRRLCHSYCSRRKRDGIERFLGVASQRPGMKSSVSIEPVLVGG
jgi:hypothetical protein